jgi:hypothetical protein
LSVLQDGVRSARALRCWLGRFHPSAHLKWINAWAEQVTIHEPVLNRAKLIGVNTMNERIRNLCAAAVLLAVLAHPDDETFGLGGTLALYAGVGCRTPDLRHTR